MLLVIKLSYLSSHLMQHFYQNKKAILFKVTKLALRCLTFPERSFVKDLPALLLSWVYRQNSSQEKSKGHDQVCPGSPEVQQDVKETQWEAHPLGSECGVPQVKADQRSRKTLSACRPKPQLLPPGPIQD